MSALQNYLAQAGAVGSELTGEAQGEFRSRSENFSLENAYDSLNDQEEGLKAEYGQDIGMASEGGAKALYFGRKIYKTFANNDVAQKYATKMANSLLGEENTKALQSAIKGGSEALKAYKGGDVSKLIEGLKGGDADAISAIKGLIPKGVAGEALTAGLEKGDSGAIKGVSSLLESMKTSGGKIVSGAKNAVTNASESATEQLTGQAKNLTSTLSELGDRAGSQVTSTLASKVSDLSGQASSAVGELSSKATSTVARATSQATQAVSDPLADVEPLDLGGSARPKPPEASDADSGEAGEFDMMGNKIQPKAPPSSDEPDIDLPEESGWSQGVKTGAGEPSSANAPVDPKAPVPDQDAPASFADKTYTQEATSIEDNPYSFANVTGEGGGQTVANMDSLFPKSQPPTTDFQFKRPTQPAPTADEPPQADLSALPDVDDLIKAQDIAKGTKVLDGSQDARDLMAKAVTGGAPKPTADAPEIKIANPFEDSPVQPTYTQGEQDLDQKMKFGEESAADRSVDPNAKPADIDTSEVSNPLFDPNDFDDEAPKLDAPKADEPTGLTPADNDPLINPTEDMSKITAPKPDDLTDALTKGGDESADLLKTGAKLGGLATDEITEGVSIGSKLLGAGGMFLEALGPIGDLAMIGSMAYSAFTAKDEGASMLAQGDKIHSQLQTLGQGASLSEGSLAGATLNTTPGSVGASFPHF